MSGWYTDWSPGETFVHQIRNKDTDAEAEVLRTLRKAVMKTTVPPSSVLTGYQLTEIYDKP
jgi:hypothetical protein